MLDDLIEVLPSSLEELVAANISFGERVDVKLKGRFKEALVCTELRVIILKSGWMTGNAFGSNIFQLPYSNVSGCDVQTGLLKNYFEVSAGGMQNTPKKVFSSNPQETAEKAPNTISLLQPDMIARFRRASSVIMQRAHDSARLPPVGASAGVEDISSALDRLWKLKCDGALSQSEFDTAKQKLIGMTDM